MCGLKGGTPQREELSRFRRASAWRGELPPATTVLLRRPRRRQSCLRQGPPHSRALRNAGRPLPPPGRLPYLQLPIPISRPGKVNSCHYDILGFSLSVQLSPSQQIQQIAFKDITALFFFFDKLKQEERIL